MQRQWDLRIPDLADVYGVAAGTAIFITIVVEVVGYMVLLIPARIKQLKNQGR